MIRNFLLWAKSRLNGQRGCEWYEELTPKIPPPQPKAEPPPRPGENMWDEMEPEEIPQKARFRVWENIGE